MSGDLFQLSNPIRNYAWGSRTALAELQTRSSPSPEPEAELWMGAHPGAPSFLPTQGQSLLSAIHGAPKRWLGEKTAAAFGGLPFLCKVLAVAEPLSLQAHPSREQARAGYLAEEARGVPRDAAERNYKDPNPKPELICSLGRFEALSGFREPAEIRELVLELGGPRLMALSEHVSGTGGLRALFASLLALNIPATTALLDELRTHCPRLVATGSRFRASAEWALRLGEKYPGDSTVALSLFLNHLVLDAGEAIYLEAGVPHTYLEGVGFEVMANSDNVLRCGLTAKHVDRDELLRVLRFEATHPAVLRGEPRGGFRVYPTPALEFLLATARVNGDTLSLSPFEARPAILFCHRGELHVKSQSSEVSLRMGESAFLGAEASGVQVRGQGDLYVTATPD